MPRAMKYYGSARLREAVRCELSILRFVVLLALLCWTALGIFDDAEKRSAKSRSPTNDPTAASEEDQEPEILDPPSDVFPD